jgi:hypothetical protein
MRIEINETKKDFPYVFIRTGDCFIHEGNFYLKTWGDELEDSAVNLETGEITFFMKDDQVQPINAFVRT